MNNLYSSVNSTDGVNLSRFFGSTNREAMQQVRLALGDDALIVSNRKVNGGVEILAASDLPNLPEPAPSAPSAPPVPAVQDTQRQQLLPLLLPVLSPGALPLAPEVFDQALREMAAQSACAQARALWQAWHQKTPILLTHDQATLDALPTATPVIAQDATPATIIVGHDQVRVDTVQEGQGQLHLIQLADLAQGVYASPLQALQFAQGWVSSCGQSALKAPGRTQAWGQQVQWLQAQVPHTPMLHVFEGGAARAWHQLQSVRAAWMSLCTPRTAVTTEDGGTSVGALARHADYRILPITHWQHSLQSCAGLPLAQINVWVASHEGIVRARGQADLAVKVTHVRVQHKRDGRILQQWSALSQSALDEATLAHVLVVRQAQKWGLRVLQACWRLCTPPDATALRLEQARLAAYMTMAAWQILQSEQTSAARQVLHALCASTQPTAQATAMGLSRLFALTALLRV